MDIIDYIGNENEINNISTELDYVLNRMGMAIPTSKFNYELGGESIDIISEYIDYDIATEATDIQEFKSRVSNLFNELGEYIYKRFKRFSPLAERSSEFKYQELKKLMDNINNEVLVPKTSIDPKSIQTFNSKLAVFYAAGYTLSNGAGDLSAFIDSLMVLPNKSGKYMAGQVLMFKSLSSKEDKLNVPRLNGLLNLKTELHGISSNANRKQKISDYRMSLVSKWFSSKVNLVAVSYTTKNGIRVHNDSFSVNSQNNKIGLANNKQTLKLIETGLKLNSALPNIYKSLAFNIKRMTRDNTVQLVKSTGSDEKKHRFLIAKFSELVTGANIGLYKDVMSIDTIIMDYVRLTYEKKNK